jgi:hypothetical protein
MGRDRPQGTKTAVSTDILTHQASGEWFEIQA